MVGAIVGGIIGGIVFILIVLGLLSYKRKRNSRTLTSNTTSPAPTALLEEGQIGNMYRSMCAHTYIYE
jgi:hypothetical protein